MYYEKFFNTSISPDRPVTNALSLVRLLDESKTLSLIAESLLVLLLVLYHLNLL